MRRLGDLPPQVVGEAVVGDLAGGHGVVEEAQGLLDGGDGVPGVHLVEVDVLDAQAPQRGVQGSPEVPPREPDVVGALTHGEPALGGENQLRRVGGVVGQPAADDLLRDAGAVDVGGVDERAPALDERLQDLAGGRLVCLGTEGHRAQRLRGHDRPAVPERGVPHGGSFR
jgi:hypothetical protein